MLIAGLAVAVAAIIAFLLLSGEQKAEHSLPICNNDGACTAPEDESNCPNDCRQHSEPICNNDGNCVTPENKYNCPDDCSGSEECTDKSQCSLVYDCCNVPKRCEKSLQETYEECAPATVCIAGFSLEDALKWANTYCDCLNSACTMLVDYAKLCDDLCEELEGASCSDPGSEAVWNTLCAPKEYSCSCFEGGNSVEMGIPVCGAIGTRSEGWSDSATGRFIKWDNCKDCVAVVSADSGSWINNCTGTVIEGYNGGAGGPSCTTEGGRYAVVPGMEPCCAGLKGVSKNYDSHGTCSLMTGATLCTNCGNDNCEPWENGCICPEDCSS